MVDVAFSQDRFLQKVLEQAKAGVSAAAVERLKAMGFTEEMSRMALHVSCSNEQRALELCMSGFTFMGADELASAVWTGQDPSAPLRQRMPSKGSKCYVCGQNFVTRKSLDIHLKSCRRRFEERESKKPEGDRRQLLEEADLPDEFNSLEDYYLEQEASKLLERESLAESAWQGTGHQILSKRPIEVPKPPTAQGDLLPCEHCKRTFLADRLHVHQKVCLQRPRDDVPPPPPTHRRSTGGSATVVQKAYDDFCNQLKRCEGCSRRFTPEVLEKHRGVCEKLLEVTSAKRHISGLAPGRSRAEQAANMKRMSEARSDTTAVATSPARSRISFAPGSRAPPHPSASASASAPRASGRRSLGSAPTSASTSTSIATSGPRRVGGFAPAARARRQSLPEKRVGQHSDAQHEELPGAAVLQEKGYLTALDDSDFEASLKMQLQERLPAAEFVGAYKVQTWHSNLYDAMRTTMIQQQRQHQKKKTASTKTCSSHSSKGAGQSHSTSQSSKQSPAGQEQEGTDPTKNWQEQRKPPAVEKEVSENVGDDDHRDDDAVAAAAAVISVSSFGDDGGCSNSSEHCSDEDEEVIAADVERELWHGTSWKTVPKILKHGFNRSFAGRHGTLLGIATYFSSNLAYSHRFCDRNGGGKDGTKAVLLSRVLVGRYCKGDPNDVEPPCMEGDDDERFDSTVDSEEKPSIFAVFRDFQAVPLVLLEFRVPPR